MYPKAENKLFNVSTSRTRKKQEFITEALALDSRYVTEKPPGVKHQNVNSQSAI